MTTKSAGARAKKSRSETRPIDRFFALFEGNKRSSGRYDPKRDRAFTEYEPLSEAHIAAHFAGELGAGAVPILDDDTCLWAAIDIDNHDSDEDLPISELDEAIRTKGLPLVACRSKSGGIHAYVFLEKPQSAARIRGFMTQWATMLGHTGAEIFPKQGRLGGTTDGKKQLGNWINLPYFDIEKTLRYAVRDGKVLTLEQFLDLAEGARVTEAQLRALSVSDHPDAPPCIQRIFTHGVPQGQRNEALYNVVVYLRKADPATAEARAQAANQSLFSKPLPKAEFGRTVASAMRPDYGFRCGEEPVRSLCNRDLCLKQKFGITPEDAERLDTVEALPIFSDLVKYISEPVRWEMRIDGVRVTNLMTAQILDWRAMRELIADRLTKIVPMLKGMEWERILGPLMKEARIVETPDDASINGVVRDRLREFAAKADLLSRGEDKEERQALLRGLPVVQIQDGLRCVMFRGQDFVNYLKRTKSEELKGVNLWFAVRDLGVDHCRVRVGSENNINVWYLPVKEVMQGMAAEPIVSKAEL